MDLCFSIKINVISMNLNKNKKLKIFDEVFESPVSGAAYLEGDVSALWLCLAL